MNSQVYALPFIGAFIGYFTNYVAIKMLFLPKKPYFVFGVRIPFTPGLIPKKRSDIIDKISNVVAHKIVNKKDIVKYIYKKKNRAFLYSFSKELIDSLLSRHISAININYDSLAIIIESYLHDNLKDIIKSQVGKIDINTDYLLYNAFLKIDKEKTIADYLNKQQIVKIKALTKNLSDKALIKLSHSLDSDTIKTLIKSKIKDAIDKYSDDTNILMASFLGMISPLIEDSDTIPRVVIEELKSLLNDEKIRQIVADSTYSSLESELLNKSPNDILKQLEFGNLEHIRETLSNKLNGLIDEFDITNKLLDNAIDKIDNKKAADFIILQIKQFTNNYTFDDILKNLLPQIREKLPSMAVNNLLFVLRKESDLIFNFDISRIAKERLNKLDISEIEDVVLNISKDQFKYINIFGGILGFMIGLIEIILQ